jgi:hypothetical protein
MFVMLFITEFELFDISPAIFATQKATSYAAAADRSLHPRWDIRLKSRFAARQHFSTSADGRAGSRASSCELREGGRLAAGVIRTRLTAGSSTLSS